MTRRGSLYQHPKARAENEGDDGEKGLQDKGACAQPGGGGLCLCLAKHWARWVEEEEAGRDFVC